MAYKDKKRECCFLEGDVKAEPGSNTEQCFEKLGSREHFLMLSPEGLGDWLKSKGFDAYENAAKTARGGGGFACPRPIARSFAVVPSHSGRRDDLLTELVIGRAERLSQARAARQTGPAAKMLSVTALVRRIGSGSKANESGGGNLEEVAQHLAFTCAYIRHLLVPPCCESSRRWWTTSWEGSLSHLSMSECAGRPGSHRAWRRSSFFHEARPRRDACTHVRARRAPPARPRGSAAQRSL